MTGPAISIDELKQALIAHYPDFEYEINQEKPWLIEYMDHINDLHATIQSLSETLDSMQCVPHYDPESL